MPTRLDHLVILVQDLEEAVGDYGRLGFSVTPGGEHADGLTRNALVPFRDGTYLELVAFVEPEGDRDNVWGWRRYLPGGGLVDYCAASDGLREEVERLRGLGFGVEDFGEGGRRLPGGREIRWRSAGFRQEGRVLPFLIEDLTPREGRVPGGPAADHPNGTTGISRLEISTPDPDKAGRDLAALMGTPPEALELGRCELVLVEGDAGQGAGPTAVTLSTDAPENAGELDPSLAHGVRFALAPEADSPTLTALSAVSFGGTERTTRGENVNDATKQRVITIVAAGIAYLISSMVTNRYINIPEQRGLKDDALEAILKGATTASSTILASVLVRRFFRD